jgi:putative tricarboxylic transport membrane protein
LQLSKKFDRAAAIVFILIGVVFVAESRRIADTAYGSVVGPDIFPMILGGVLALLGLRLLMETFRYPDQSEKKERPDVKRFAVILAATILYGALLETLGYILSTFLFLVVAFQTMERGSWGKTFLISGAFSVGVYGLFVMVLEGTLPGLPFWLSG